MLRQILKAWPLNHALRFDAQVKLRIQLAGATGASLTPPHCDRKAAFTRQYHQNADSRGFGPFSPLLPRKRSVPQRTSEFPPALRIYGAGMSRTWPLVWSVLKK